MKNILLFALVCTLFLSTGCFATERETPMNNVQAGIIGVVEGVTEYLPVSSTGHIMLTQRLLGIDMEGPQREKAADAYAVCIQLGAIIAVLGLYPGRFKSILLGIMGKDNAGRRLLMNLLIAFLPAAVAGLVFHNLIQKYLFGLWPIVIAWFAGGLLMLIISPRTSPDVVTGKELDEMDPISALWIGVIQCIAMWPGVSRSFSTIIGGIFTGYSVKASVEFSFLLGVITLGAATLYEGHKYIGDVFDIYGWLPPVLGCAIAFVSAVISIKWLVNYLNNHGMQLFGWYRIGIAFLSVCLMIFGVMK